jgi:hypothetical protein
MRPFLLVLLCGICAVAQPLPPLNDGACHGDPRYLLENGWKPLINGKDMQRWRAEDGKPLEWVAVQGVRWDGGAKEQLLAPHRCRRRHSPERPERAHIELSHRREIRGTWHAMWSS